MMARSCRMLHCVAAAIMLTACANQKGPDMDPLTELQTRDSYEDTVAAYTIMQEDMRTAINRAAPSVTWTIGQKSSRAGCGDPFSGLGGKSLALDSWNAEGGIPDERWAATVVAATEVADRYGFDSTQTIVDQPGDHQVRLSNSRTGAFIDFGTYVNTVLGTTTGCHLPDEPLTPIPPPTTTTTR